MSLSDCLHCWETPCGCGYEYRKYTFKRRLELAWEILVAPIKWRDKNEC